MSYNSKDFRALKISTPNGAILTGSEVDDINDALEAAAREVEMHEATRERCAEAMKIITGDESLLPPGACLGNNILDSVAISITKSSESGQSKTSGQPEDTSSDDPPSCRPCEAAPLQWPLCQRGGSWALSSQLPSRWGSK